MYWHFLSYPATFNTQGNWHTRPDTWSCFWRRDRQLLLEASQKSWCTYLRNQYVFNIIYMLAYFLILFTCFYLLNIYFICSYQFLFRLERNINHSSENFQEIGIWNLMSYGVVYHSESAIWNYFCNFPCRKLYIPHFSEDQVTFLFSWYLVTNLHHLLNPWMIQLCA